MILNKWNCAAQRYDAAFTFLGGRWWDSSFTPNVPVLNVGESCLITNPGPAVTWTRTFIVNP